MNKRKLLQLAFAALMLFGFKTQAQLTLEHSFSGSNYHPVTKYGTTKGVGTVSGKVIKHMIVIEGIDSVKIYNLDFSLYKEFSVSGISSLSNISRFTAHNASTHAYNNDDLIEFEIGFVDIVDNGNLVNYQYERYLMNENGDVLQRLPVLANLTNFGTYELQNELFTVRGEFSDSGFSGFKIYSLGGESPLSLESAIAQLDTDLSAEIDELRKEIKVLEDSLSADITELDTDLTKDIDELDTDLSGVDDVLTKRLDSLIAVVTNLKDPPLSTPNQQTQALSGAYPYPNPASRLVSLPFRFSSGNDVISIHDSEGRLIESKMVAPSSKSIELDVSGYKEGIYLYKYNGVSNKFVVIH
ncbi:MAG: T9SS type A sorting domain-containing protein [Ekhidna sp.]|nr:T9SS type A sorting domain-containing protein [Ekhidna sp.]